MTSIAFVHFNMRNKRKFIIKHNNKNLTFFTTLIYFPSKNEKNLENV